MRRLPHVPKVLSGIALAAVLASCGDLISLGPAPGSGTAVGAVTPGFTSVPQDGQPPWAPAGAAEPYRYLGRAHYDGKPLLGLEADFDQLAISPDGKRVVFRGRESRDDYALFVAEVDGAIQVLGATSLEPQGLSWSSDATSLVYMTQDTTREGMRPDAPANVPAMPNGRTVHQRDLATGRDRDVMKLPGLGVFFPSPTHRHAAVYGFAGMGGSKVGAPFDLVDMATGQRSALGGGIQQVYLTYAAQWSGDGRRLAVIDPLPPPDQGMRVVTYAEPAWTPTEVTRKLAGPGRIWWNAGGDALETYRVTANQELVLEAVGPSPRPLLSVALDAPPPGYRYDYELVGQSPGRHRLLFTRTAAPTSPQFAPMLVVAPAQAPVHLLVDRRTGKHTAIAPGFGMVGWLDESRLLAYGGRDQRKRLVVVPVEPPA